MTDKPTRDCILPQIRTTSDELLQIKQNAAASPLNSVSAYVRDMAINGMVIQRDSIGDKQLLLSLSAIGNNLNQSSKSLNELALASDAIGDPKMAAKAHETMADIAPVLAQIGTIMDELMR